MNDRQEWLQILEKLATPVLEAGAARELARRMPSEHPNRAHFAPLEAAARLMCGLAPWLELDDQSDERETRMRARFRVLARETMDSLTDPASPDYVDAEVGNQPLVDAAKLAQAVLYAPQRMWGSLDTRVQSNFVAYLHSMRAIRPGFNNWLLFAAVDEAALCFVGAPWDRMRVDYALRQHEQWYAGDGFYNDGPQFHFDFYNSLVIHPLLINTIRHVEKEDRAWAALSEPIWTRARRHAVVLERMISPEGTFPPVGRSLGYRFGVFHGLSQMALLHELPPELPPSQVRSALTLVMKRMIEAPGTFDDQGWLRLGFCGHQPQMAEYYLSNASSYFCALALLPLGLPPSDPFWSGPALPWTSKRLWDGEDLPADHAL